jgi:DNA integrity scanning protein DisA with diadenylate cyclase activity
VFKLLANQKSMFKFQKNYFFGAILLFLTEILIAIFVHDSIIRPFGGDFLVVILLYFFVKSFWNTSVLKVAVSVLLFSFLIEILQYFQLVKLLHLQHSNLAKTVMGTSFAWGDILAYSLGFLAILVFERRFSN